MKKLLGVVLAALLVLTALPHGADVISGDMTSGLVTTAWAEGETPHTHCVCNKTADPGFTGHTHKVDQTWKPVKSLNEITEDGYYYLTENVTLGYSSWDPQDGVVLCLNGHSIYQPGSESVICVSGRATFTLTDCKPDGVQGEIKHVEDPRNNNIVHYDHGVYVTYGTFNMYGGRITRNTSGYVSSGSPVAGEGGGVYVGDGIVGRTALAVFNMYGGTITGNKADQGGKGGGAYVESGRTFNMYGGTISGNTADVYGGGVFVESGATFTMSGTASITKNTAGTTTNGFGGGVYSKGTFNLSGGTITENTANCASFTNQLGGGVMAAGGNLNLSGNPVVKNNIGKDADNVRVDEATMEVTAALTEGAEIILNSLKDPTINPTGKSDVWYKWDEAAKTLTAGTGGGESGEHANHPVCGASCGHSGSHGAINGWQAITTEAELRAATQGYYYLKNDIALVEGGPISVEAWKPADGVVLCLNGHSIKAKVGNSYSIIDITEGKHFTLTDCRGTGSITNSNSVTGYGVFVGDVSPAAGENDPYLFTMYGGKIVGVDEGVHVSAKKGFAMYGGTISGCAEYGVRVFSGGAYLCGGTITNNAEYGVYDIGTLAISGNTTITGNGSAEKPCNVFLTEDRSTIGLRGFVGRFGITTEATPYEGRNVPFADNAPDDYASRITSDEGYGMTKEGGTLYLTPKTVAVESVALNKTALSLVAGNSVTLTATVTPDNATNKNVTWSSSSESVAKVVDGKVTAVSKGTAIITVTTVDGGKTATCTVTVTAQSGGHSHVFSDTWTTNATHHWHACTAAGCPKDDGSVNSYGAHVYDNDADTTCNVCGYTRTISGGETTPTNRYYYYSGGSTKQDTTKNGPKTGDAGMLVYLGLALSSYTGAALAVRRKREF